MVDCWKFRITETVETNNMGTRVVIAIFSYDLHGIDDSRNDWAVATVDGTHAVMSETYGRWLARLSTCFTVVRDTMVEPIQCDYHVTEGEPA